MSIYMAAPDYSISSPMGDDLYANMMVGGNGDTDDYPEFDVGDDQGMENWGYCTWDSNDSGGFDSGSVPIQFEASTNGNETLQVGTNPQVSYTGDSIDSISAVDIQAAVTQQGEAKWSNISVEFYSGSTLEEVDSPTSGPDANTTDTPSTPQEEQIMTITPTASDITSVIVTGMMRMTAPAGTTPSSTGMFCNIVVLGSHGTMSAG